MALEWIDIVRAGPRQELDDPEAGTASLLIASSCSGHQGSDYLEVVGGLEHYSKITPGSVEAAEKWIAWLQNWIEEKA